MELDSRHLMRDPVDGEWKRVMFYLHDDGHVRWYFRALTAYEKDHVHEHWGKASLNIPTMD